MSTESRRPLKTRSRGWAKKAADLLADTNISPNQISVASVVIAALGTAALLVDHALYSASIWRYGVYHRGYGLFGRPNAFGGET